MLYGVSKKKFPSCSFDFSLQTAPPPPKGELSKSAFQSTLIFIAELAGQSESAMD